MNSKKLYIALLSSILSYFLINAARIYSYSFNYNETPADVAVVLGAGTHNGKVSPIFRERINHAVYLYQKGIVKKIILTGGFGKNQKISDSRTAQYYAIKKGVPKQEIFIEESSKYTIQNLSQTKQIMDSVGLQSALLVSDPMHMKRAMLLARSYKINCKTSPTKTSMYQSNNTKAKQLIYETFYFSLREPLSIFSSK